MSERNIKIILKEYIVNNPSDDIKLSMELYSNHFLPTVKPHTIFYKNKTINDENIYNGIIKIVNDNIDIIKKLNLENINSYKGGLQEIISIQLDNNNYSVIGNTDNQEMKQLYNKLKEEIINILNISNNLFEQDENGAFIRLIIPAEFVRTILSPEKNDDMDLRGKKTEELTTDEVIVLKKYAYELSENKKANDMNNNITFEKAKEMATEEASKHGKIIETIEENDEYWLFKAGFEDGHRDFDDEIGSIYISKVDGSTRGLNLWDMDFTRKFKESAKEIYNYSDNK